MKAEDGNAVETKAVETKAVETKAVETKAATVELTDAKAKTAAAKSATAKATPTKTTATKTTAAKTTPARTAAPKSTAAKASASKATTKPEPKAAPAPPRPVRSAAETEKIRAALSERRDELKTEYDQTMSEIAEAQRDRLTDSAGDDQADTGTKTFEREQEISLANNLRERIGQVERALDRLDDGQYGWCERCGNAIPVERLAAFPSATLCVTCKQLEERR